MGRRRLRIPFAAAAALALALPGAVRAGEPEVRTTDLFVRRVGARPADAVDALAAEAKRRGVRHVVAVFDAVSFGPPPGPSEFEGEYRYRRDLDAWLDALGAWSRRGVAVWAATTIDGRAEEVGSPGWAAKVRAQADRKWWEEPAFQGFEPADAWVTRFLAQRGWIADMPGPNAQAPEAAMLVLLGGPLGPERWVPDGGFLPSPDELHWRRFLRPAGTYWDEERIAAQCRRARCALFVVAPEARWGDESPESDAPDLPWVSRPTWPPRPPPIDDEGEDGGGLDSLPPEVRAAVLEALRGKLPSADFGPPRRFRSDTPFWYASFSTGDVRVFHSDLPTGWGHWPLARAAAATGGRYVFYPFPATEWLDRLPYEGALLADLAPPYASLAEWRAQRAADPVRRAWVQAEEWVRARTPWADSNGKACTGWSAFSVASPAARPDGWRARRKPYDLVPTGDEKTIQAEGRRLAEVLPAYDRALEVLDRALREWRAGVHDGLPRRDHARLLVARFEHAMSAFHLHALSLYMTEIERFRPPGFEKHVLQYVVTYVPTIRMSDVLDGYEGRVLPDEEEERLSLPIPGEEPPPPGYQGNLLPIPETSPWYRARRAPDRVLARLDTRLLPDALRLIATARDVFEAYPKTPFGAVVYYADAYTFVWKPVTDLRGNVGPAGKPKDAKPPPGTTPPDPTPSDPGGPTTPDGPGTPGPATPR